MPDLIITNGDSAADLLRIAGRDDPILPWRDVLHEGPITEAGLLACSEVRIGYLAARFRASKAQVEEEFAARDAMMARHAEFDTIELWFEHDLYDQLQLIQVLAFFADAKRLEGLTLVQADDFLGSQRPDTILRFAEIGRPVEQSDLDRAGATWIDLVAPSPEKIAARAVAPDDMLPYLAPALGRFLAELPAPGNGLGRTEQAIVDGIAGGIATPRALFHDCLGKEEAAFMGDWSFYRLLDDLSSCDVPLIAGVAPPGTADDDEERFADARLTLTAAGEDVDAGGADHVALSGLDRWWAGTRLSGRSVWRYDRDALKLVAPAESSA
jgi:hypothetical protein